MVRSQIVLIFANLFHFIGIFSARPYMTLLAAENGANDVQIGLVAAVYSIVQALIAIPISKIVVGNKLKMTMIFGGLCFIFGSAGLTIAINAFFIGLCSLLLGLSHVLILMSFQYKVTSISGHARYKHIGLYAFSSSVGVFVGPIFGGIVYDYFGSNHSFWCVTILGIVAMIMVLFIDCNSLEKETENWKSLQNIIQNKEVLYLTLISAIVIFTTEVITVYFPLYGQQLGLSTIAIGMILSFGGMSQMLIRPFLGLIAGNVPKAKLLAICLLCAGIGVFCYGVFHTYHQLLLIAACSGLFLGLLHPLTMALVVDVTPPKHRGFALSLRITGTFLGQSISSPIFGVLSILFGLSPVFLISGIILMSGTLFCRKTI